MKTLLTVAAAVLVAGLTGCECTSCGKGWWGSQGGGGPTVVGSGAPRATGGVMQAGGTGADGGVVPAGGLGTQGAPAATGQVGVPVFGDGEGIRVSKPAACTTGNCATCPTK